MVLWSEFTGGRDMEPQTKIPVQVHLYPEQIEELQPVADRRHVSLEDVIRQSVGTLLITLDLQENPPSEEGAEDDPLRDMIGMFHSGVGDLAENHDQYIVELIAGESQPWPEKSS
jgi:hypothetical protein